MSLTVHKGISQLCKKLNAMQQPEPEQSQAPVTEQSPVSGAASVPTSAQEELKRKAEDGVHADTSAGLPPAIDSPITGTPAAGPSVTSTQAVRPPAASAPVARPPVANGLTGGISVPSTPAAGLPVASAPAAGPPIADAAASRPRKIARLNNENLVLSTHSFSGNVTPAGDEKFTIFIIPAPGDGVRVHTTRNTPLEYALSAYASHFQVSLSTLRMVWMGKPVNHARTPQELGMRDGEFVGVTEEQSGS